MTDINITITVAKDGTPTVKVSDAPITVANKTSRKVGQNIRANSRREVLAILEERRGSITTTKTLQRLTGRTQSQIWNAVFDLRRSGVDIHTGGSRTFGYQLVG